MLQGDNRKSELILHDCARHWKAIMEYHKIRDILHIMKMLGHHRIENTLIYARALSDRIPAYQTPIKSIFIFGNYKHQVTTVIEDSRFSKEMRRIAIGLCGEMYSGKDTIANYLVSRYGFSKYSYSVDVLGPIIKLSRGVETREVYIDLGISLDRMFGKYCLDMLLHRIVVIDGCFRIVIPNIRLLNNVEYWRDKSGFEFYLVAVLADKDVRLRRWRIASLKKTLPTYNSGIKSASDFQRLSRKDLEETDLEKLLAMRKFEFVVDNNLGFSELYAQIDKIIKKLEI